MRLMFNSMGGGQGSTPPPPLSPTTELLSEGFNSLPSEWTNNGFTISSGASVAGVGGMGTNLYFEEPTYLDGLVLSATFELKDLTSAVGIGKDGFNRIPTTLYQRGALFKIDFNTNELKFGAVSGDTAVAPIAEPTYVKTEALTINKVLNDSYTITATRDVDTFTFEIFNTKDPLTKDTLVFSYLDPASAYITMFWGRPNFWFFNGDVTLTNYKMTALHTSAPRIGIFGDSISESGQLIDFIAPPHTLENRYGSKIVNANTKSCYMSPRGGTKTLQCLEEMQYILPLLTPEYATVMIGTNDRANPTGFFDNWPTIVALCASLGVKMVAGKIPPSANSQPNINNMNAVIDQALVDGDIFDIVHSDIALSTGDGVTRDDSLFYSPVDLHPNILGHQAIYDEIAANNQYLLG